MAKRRSPSIPKVWQYIGVAVIGAVVVGLSVAALQPRAPAVSAQDRVVPSAEDFAADDERVVFPDVLFIGDSYTAGTGATSKAERWTTLVADQLDWFEFNHGYGGTGYVVTAGRDGCGADYCPSYPEAIAAVTDVEPGIIVISGGRNDGERAPDYSAAITATIQAAQTRWPEAQIVVTSPLWDDDPVPAWFPETITAARDAATATGATWVDLGQPLAGRTDFLVSDGVHPNDAGYAAIAAAFVAAWPA